MFGIAFVAGRVEILSFVKSLHRARRRPHSPPIAAAHRRFRDILSDRSLADQPPSHARQREPQHHKTTDIDAGRRWRVRTTGGVLRIQSRSRAFGSVPVAQPEEREGAEGERVAESRAHLRRTPGPRCRRCRGGWWLHSSTRRYHLGRNETEHTSPGQKTELTSTTVTQPTARTTSWLSPRSFSDAASYLPCGQLYHKVKGLVTIITRSLYQQLRNDDETMFLESCDG